jgi:hypothetical protein
MHGIGLVHMHGIGIVHMHGIGLVHRFTQFGTCPRVYP